MVGSVNLVLPPGDTVPVINNPNTKDRVELAAAAAIAYIVGEILVTAVANPSVEHQKVLMKRALCVIYKQATCYAPRSVTRFYWPWRERPRATR